MNTQTQDHHLQPGIVTQLPVSLLSPDPCQPRAEIAPEALRGLAADIAARGIELPIVVSQALVIKDGERRWRAAQQAGLETVPCILHEAEASPAGALDWRLDQVCDNHHREPLNALDWARVLKELVDVHKKPVGEIPKLLEQRGITMSRSYISNLIRLNDLPDWARAHIAKGVLPPAAGKYILMAAAHAPAMKKLQQVIDRDVKQLEPGHALRGDLSWSVRRAYQDTATTLSRSYGTDVPRFDWKKSCAECKTRAQVDGEHFCLNRKCYDEKQAAADAAKKTAKPKPGKKTAAPKQDAKAAARAKLQHLQRQAHNNAETLAVGIIAKQAEAGLSAEDRRVVALILADMADLKPIFTRRGWPQPKNFSPFEAGKVAARELAKLNAKAVDAFILECALQDSYNGQTKAAIKRYRIDLKALEKAELARLKAATQTAPKPAVANKKPAKKKGA